MAGRKIEGIGRGPGKSEWPHQEPGSFVGRSKRIIMHGHLLALSRLTGSCPASIDQAQQRGEQGEGNEGRNLYHCLRVCMCDTKREEGRGAIRMRWAGGEGDLIPGCRWDSGDILFVRGRENKIKR